MMFENMIGQTLLDLIKTDEKYADLNTAIGEVEVSGENKLDIFLSACNEVAKRKKTENVSVERLVEAWNGECPEYEDMDAENMDDFVQQLEERASHFANAQSDLSEYKSVIEDIRYYCDKVD